MLRRELNVFPMAVVRSDDDGSVVCRIGEFLRLPDELARLLVERGNRALATARGANNLVAVHEHGFTVTPARRPAAEVLHRFPPNHLAVGSADTNQVTLSAQRINAISIHSGCTSRPAATIKLYHRPEGRNPKLFTRLGIQRK